MVTTEEWQTFLQKWSDQWLTTDDEFPDEVRSNRWLGFEPATPQQVNALEKRLGYALPPSYRAFLLTSNGWRNTTSLIQQIRPAEQVQWLDVDDPEHVESWCDLGEELVEGLTREEYFSYDAMNQERYSSKDLAASLKIADPVPGDSIIYLLNPRVVAEDGEWEAWQHAHWIPGAIRYPSFAHLMRQEYEVFRATVLKTVALTLLTGPFKGVYAPNRPRRRARKIGPGKAVRRRLTVEQLIEQLEDPSQQARLAAAKLLSREARRQAPTRERARWAERLARIIQSGREREVRLAAVLTLGKLRNAAAVPPLIEALKEPTLAKTAVGALLWLSMDVKVSRAADALCEFLEHPRDNDPTAHALGMLVKLGDPRFREIAFRIVDSGRGKVSTLAAWHLAQSSLDVTEALIERLKHEKPEVRMAAASALWPTKDRRAIKPLQAARRDRDAMVRQVAAESLSHLRDDLER